MKIVVCVKQAPYIGDLRFDASRGVLVREGVTNVLNAFDRPAVVAAVELAGEHDGDVVAVTLGPPAARTVLREALALGAGWAVHLCDPALAGSDTLGTARALAAAIRREGPVDLVLLGQRSTDGDTALVGPILAGLLDLPLLAGVTACHLSGDGRTITAERETENGPEMVSTTLPALLTAAERLRPAVSLAPEAKAAANAKPLVSLKVSDLGLSPDLVGAAGAASRVLGARSIARQRAGRIINGDDPTAAVEALARELVERGIFDDAPGEPDENAPLVSASPGVFGAIWVVLSPADLAGPAGAAVLTLAHGAAPSGAEISRPVPDHALAALPPETVAASLAAAIDRDPPLVVLLPATPAGREIAGRVAAARGLGIVSDCRAITWDDAGRPILVRPTLGGDLLVSVAGLTRPVLATVDGTLRPHPSAGGATPLLWSAAATDASGHVPDRAAAPADREGFTVPPVAPRVRIVRPAPPAGASGPRIETAPIVIGIGRGVGPPENHAPIEELAATIGGVIGATRKVTDAGWLPRERQIGLTGRPIAPRFYLAIGVRGLSHHAVGIRQAGTIAVVNDNPKAAIWSLADTGIVGDWTEIVPRLTAALRRLRPQTE